MLNLGHNGGKPNTVGGILRYWRRLKKMSQMELALNANVSSRHLSFVETGKAQPSRNLILRIADSLNLPFRQRNALLRAAGYVSEFRNVSFNAAEMDIVHDALRRMLAKHEPYPAVVVNTAYEILMTNTGFDRIVTWCAGEDALRKYGNIYRLVFAEDGLRPCFEDWPVVERFLRARLLAEVISTQNEDLIALYEDIIATETNEEEPDFQIEQNIPVMSFTLQKGSRQASFFSTITTFGTPLDVTTQELRIESLFPADEATRQLFHTAAF